MSKPELMIAAWPANPIKVDDYHYNDSTTAHGDAGRTENRVIGCDNSGALEVF